jgi:hypothetical protein
MKLKHILILICICSSAQVASAQEGWRLGFEGGTLFSRTFFTDSTGDDYKKKYYTGYRFGTTLNWGKTEFNGFSLGVYYVDKGLRYQYKTNDSSNTIAQIKQGTQFLEIPLCMFFKQDLGITGFVRESFGIGGAFQLTKYDSAVTNSKTNVFSMYNNRNTKFNAYFRLGIEIGNRFDNGDLLTLGVHYQQGFGTISDQTFFNPLNNKKYFSTKLNGSYIGLTLGYHFNLTNIGSKEEFFTKNSPVSVSH